MSLHTVSFLRKSGAAPTLAQQHQQHVAAVNNAVSCQTGRLAFSVEVCSLSSHPSRRATHTGSLLGLEGSRTARDWAPRLSGNTESIALSQEAVSSTNPNLSTTDSLGFTEEAVSEVESSVNGAANEESLDEDESQRNFDSGREEAGPTVEEAKVAAGINTNIQTVPLRKGKGYVITDLLVVFGGLLDRPFGSGQMIAAAGEVVVERVISELENADTQSGVDAQRLSDFRTCLNLLEKDLEVVSAAKGKPELLEALELAKLHCRQQSYAMEVGDTAESREPDGDTRDVLIECRNVFKTFGEKQILKGASFKIRNGEAVGIIGPSGTGKSTVLRIMAGLLAPDKGEVYIRGKLRHGLISDEELSGLRIGLVFQSAALFDSLTVRENVGFMLYEHSNLPDDRINELVTESLAAVGLKNVEERFPAELSGGMKKRVALARAIISDNQDREERDPEVVMYDEPTAGLDPIASTVVEDLIRSMHRKGRDARGKPGKIASYVVVTHQHSTIRRAVDRLLFLHDGKVVWEGTTAEFDTTTNPIVRQFAAGNLDGPIRY